MNAREARRGNRWPLLLGVWIAVLTYGWWFTGLEPFSDAATRALLVPVVVLIVGATIYRSRHDSGERDAATRAAPRFRAAAVVWSALVVTLVAWELLALRSLPRSDHPTISSLVEGLAHHHIARLALFALWILLGWTLAS
jgi:TRAP-type C4-dicarboxylate transport system permease large subunit